jgi:hypothetical protein
MAGLQAAKPEPDVRSHEQVEMGRDPEPVDREVHDLDRNSGCAALA